MPDVLLGRLQLRQVLSHLLLLGGKLLLRGSELLKLRLHGSKMLLLSSEMLYVVPHGGKIQRHRLQLLHYSRRR